MPWLFIVAFFASSEVALAKRSKLTTEEAMKVARCPADYYEPAVEKGIFCCRPKGKSCFETVKWDSKMSQDIVGWRYNDGELRDGLTHAKTTLNGKLHGPDAGIWRIGQHREGRKVGAWRYYWKNKKDKMVFIAQIDYGKNGEKALVKYPEKKPGVPAGGVKLVELIYGEQRERIKKRGPAVGMVDVKKAGLEIVCTKPKDCSEAYMVYEPDRMIMIRDEVHAARGKYEGRVQPYPDADKTYRYFEVYDKIEDWCQAGDGWIYCKEGFIEPFEYFKNGAGVSISFNDRLYEKPGDGFSIEKERTVVELKSGDTDFHRHIRLVKLYEIKRIDGVMWAKGSFALIKEAKHIKDNLYYSAGPGLGVYNEKIAVGDVILKQKPVWFPLHTDSVHSFSLGR